MKYEITKDHIGIFDCENFNSFSERCIKFYKQLEKNNIINERKNKKHEVDDSAYDLITSGFYNTELSLPYVSNEFLDIFFKECYSLYVKKYSILNNFQRHNIYDIKLQKTSIGQGYHIWHTENMHMHSRNRICVFSLYLNDVKDGGETEFLYQSKRFKPIKNRLLIWPAGYTHVHRGNPPLSNDKYIVTGWIEYGN